MLDPLHEWTVTDLAEHVDEIPITVSREVAIAEEAGLVSTRRVGRLKLVTANVESPYHEPLSRLLLVAFGPRQIIAEALTAIPGVVDAFIFGSWAERYHGVRGPYPNDIDVLVIGGPDRNAVYDAVDAAEKKLGSSVQVTFRTPVEWTNGDDPFVATVQSRLRVGLFAESNRPSDREEEWD